MKIALCGRFNTEKKHQGGSAEVFLTLAKGLSKRNEVTLFGRGKPTYEIKNMCKANNIKYYYIPSDKIINIILGPLRALILMRKYWDNFDIVHTHTGSFAFASIFFKKKSKIITHIHEGLILKDNTLIVKFYLNLENFLLRLACNNSKLVITVGEYMKSLIKQKWKINKVKSIPNGADLKLFKFKKNNKVTDLFGKNNFKLLYVGRLTKRKGILELIDSFNYLRNKKLTLLIVGDGELYSEVEKRLPGQCKLIRYVNNKDLPDYYSAADLVIVPSHYEPGSLVPRESLACGTPILVSNNTGLREIKIAYFIKELNARGIADSIKEFSNKKLISRKTCRDYAEKNYDWESIINKYEGEYKKLIK